METTVTMVRLYLPEETHSTRKAQMERILHFLRDELHVHGIVVLHGVKELEDSPKLHYQTVGDILRNPDPPLIIEFYCENSIEAQVRRLLCERVPNSWSTYWQAVLQKGTTAASGEVHASAVSNA